MADDNTSGHHLNIARDEQTPSVLIVDDVMSNIQLLAAILDRHGYDIQFATSGVEILDDLADREVDLVLLDIMMPVMDGYEVCRRIKKNPQTAHIPVIFLTAKNSLQERLKGFDAGAVDYITKPFEVREVLVRVETHVSLKRYRERVERYNGMFNEILSTRTRELVDKERRAAIEEILDSLRIPAARNKEVVDRIESLLKTIDPGVTDEKQFTDTIQKVHDYLGELNKIGSLLQDILSATAVDSPDESVKSSEAG